jgi:hypothetical protein
MGKIIKMLVILGFIAALLYAGSYAGARATVGKFLGAPSPEMGARTARLAFDGIKEIPSRPRAWEFNYSRIAVYGNRPGKIFVTLKGKIISTIPRDLEARLAAWRKAKEVN